MLEPELWGAPMVIAHRGSRELWPENTMAAFDNAVALGVEHVETDVHVSADGIVHCFHDSTLHRTTGHPGLFSTLSSAEIAELDAGFNHRAQDGFPFRNQGLRIPAFEELATSYPDLRIVVDLKEDAVVGPFASLVSRLDLFDRIIVGSFADERIAAFRGAVSGGVKTSTGFKESRRWLRAARRSRTVSGSLASALQLPLQWRGLPIIDGRLVESAHEAGLQVHVWTINTESRMRELVGLGVDGLITDRPDRALAITEAQAD